MGLPLFSYLVLLSAIAAYLFVFIGSTLPSVPVMFALQAAVIASFGWQVLRMRKYRPASWTRPVPTLVKILVVLIAVAGAASFVISLQRTMPNLSPTGAVVTRFHWALSNEACEVTYNSAETLERPAAECRNYDRYAGLAFGGGWLLFSAIAVWFSHLGAKVKDGIGSPG
jgi:hypothetical protein